MSTNHNARCCTCRKTGTVFQLFSAFLHHPDDVRAMARLYEYFVVVVGDAPIVCPFCGSDDVEGTVPGIAAAVAKMQGET